MYSIKYSTNLNLFKYNAQISKFISRNNTVISFFNES